MTAIAHSSRPARRAPITTGLASQHADHHAPGGAPLPADAAADRDGHAADVAVLPDLPLHVRRRDPRRLDPVRRLPRARLRRHRRALLRDRRSRRHGRGPRAGVRRPAPLAADPARRRCSPARAIADTAILTLSSAVTVAIAFAVGFRLHGSVARRASPRSGSWSSSASRSSGCSWPWACSPEAPRPPRGWG